VKDEDGRIHRVMTGTKPNPMNISCLSLLEERQLQRKSKRIQMSLEEMMMTMMGDSRSSRQTFDSK
jgi:hypothetical protein